MEDKDIRNRILDKLKERFEQFGLKKTTMDEISRDCQISKKTIYEHFANKEDLFLCLVVREIMQACTVIISRVPADTEPVERLIAMLRTAIGYFKEENFLTRFLRDDGLLVSPVQMAKYQALVDEEVIAMIAEIIRAGKQQGSIRDVDEQVVAYAGLKLLQAFSYLQTMPVCPAKDKQGYYTEALVDFILHGLVQNGAKAAGAVREGEV